MGEKINKEFEEYQKQLEIREKRLKMIISFNMDDDVDEVIKTLKDKEITL